MRATDFVYFMLILCRNASCNSYVHKNRILTRKYLRDIQYVTVCTLKLKMKTKYWADPRLTQ